MPDELVVLHKNQGSIGFYDLDSLRETDCLELDPYPHEFVLEVCVVALDTLAMKTTIKTRAGPDPTAVIRH